MPELPDLVHVEAELRRALAGRRVVGARTGDPLVLRIMTEAPFPGVLVGRTIAAVERRGHFVCFALEDDAGAPLHLVVNCMLAGRFVLARAAGGKLPRAVALALVVEGAREGAPDGEDLELRYSDDRRMGKVYVAPPDRLAEIPQLGALGVEVLSDAFTLPLFRALVAKRRDQVRQFLMDKSALASIGNAYADEILFDAKIHPKTFCRKLAPAEIDALHASIGGVLRAAIDEITSRGGPVDEKVRDFLKVRGRGGKPCPTCGTTIRETRVGDGDACFCPRCQPTERKLFVDWSKLPPKQEP